MPWPPAPLPVNFGNATVSLNTHPTAHNATNSQLNNSIVPQLVQVTDDLAQVTDDLAQVEADLDPLTRWTSEVRTPTAPWTGTVTAHKLGKIVVVQFVVTRPAPESLDGGFAMATIPVGYRPEVNTANGVLAVRGTNPTTKVATSAFYLINTDGTVVVQTRVEDCLYLNGSVTYRSS